MAEIRNLLFDYGNVIIDLDIEGCFENLRALFPKEINEKETMKVLTNLIKKQEVGEISDELFINGVIKHARKNVQALDVIHAWNSILVGIPPYRLTMLEQLREKFSITLLSNTNAMHIAWATRHLEEIHGILDFEKEYFDDVYYSHLIGLRKPDDACFKYASEHGFLTPKHTLFLDDNEANIESAKKLGFQTHLTPPEEEIAEWLKIEGFY